MNKPDKRDTTYHVVYLALATVVLGAACLLRIQADGRVVTPVYQVALPGTCWFHNLTGYPCPGCGLTRCFICLADGRLARAWSFNPAGLVVFVLVVAQVPYRVIQVWRIRHDRTPWYPRTTSSVLAYALAGALLLQWICRWPS